MKEDILEQITEDWLLSQSATFTKTNVRFKPDELHQEYIKKEDSNYSDIDILAVHLDKYSFEKVSVVSCKSWQGGFDPEIWTSRLSDPNKHNQIISGRECWKFFRELVKPKWTKAFVDKVKAETQSSDFTYYLAVTSIIEGKDKKVFENCSYFLDYFKAQGAKEVKIRIITFSEIFTSFFKRNDKHTLEPTLVGRLLQVIKASNLTEHDLKVVFDTTDIELFSEETLSIAKKKDSTKFKFNGKAMGKGKLVLTVIQNYVNQHPDTTFKMLEEIFPHKLQGKEVFTDVDSAIQKARKRNFTKPDQLVKLKDSVIAVSTQWGIFNINNFISHCRNNLGFNIEEVL